MNPNQTIVCTVSLTSMSKLLHGLCDEGRF